jgi:hypothetical protein
VPGLAGTHKTDAINNERLDDLAVLPPPQEEEHFSPSSRLLSAVVQSTSSGSSKRHTYISLPDDATYQTPQWRTRSCISNCVLSGPKLPCASLSPLPWPCSFTQWINALSYTGFYASSLGTEQPQYRLALAAARGNLD